MTTIAVPRELLEQALTAIEELQYSNTTRIALDSAMLVKDALTAAAPTPQAGEPVAWHFRLNTNGDWSAWMPSNEEHAKWAATQDNMQVRSLYTHPAPTPPEQEAHDAARYRWLRDNREARNADGTMTYTADEHGALLYDEELDAAIDAAMKEPT